LVEIRLWYNKERKINQLFKFMRRKKLTINYFVKNISTVFGLVLIWRGIWYALDSLDIFIFGGSHAWTALGGIIIGLIILWAPDRDLKEIEKL